MSERLEAEIERRAEDIRMTAVGLTNQIVDLNTNYGVDMREEIIAYFHEKLDAVGE